MLDALIPAFLKALREQYPEATSIKFESSFEENSGWKMRIEVDREDWSKLFRYESAGQNTRATLSTLAIAVIMDRPEKITKVV